MSMLTVSPAAIRSRLTMSWSLGFLLLLLTLGLPGCGSGSGGGGGGDGSSGGGGTNPPPPTPNFSLAVSPGTETITAGTSGAVSLSATAMYGFSSQVSVQVGGLPAGVSVSPSALTLTPGIPQQVTLSVADGISTANQTITFTGSSGSLTQTTQLSLSLYTFNGLPTRTRYVRTDATTNYWLSINQHWIVYHPNTARYFVTDTSNNQVIVVDAATETKIASIIVPQAFGIDITQDQSLLWVGTMIGDVYSIDPVAMTVTSRYKASQIGTYGFFANTTLALANGQLALIGGPSTPELGQVVSIAIWNPENNSIVYYGANGANPSNPLPCDEDGNEAAGFALSADRTQILFGFGGALCEMNASTGTGVSANALLESVAVYHIAVTPDGKYVILANNTSSQAVATVLNAQTLALVSQFNVLGDTSGDSGFFVSADSATLFTPNDSIIYAYDLATQQLVGWAPNIFVRPDFSGVAGGFGPVNSPYYLATDGTGLYVGPIGQGIGFVDLSTLQTGPVSTQFQDASLNPATGPTSGGNATQWADEGPIGPLTSIVFGKQPAGFISATAGSNDLVNIGATSPAGAAGAADIYLFTADGGMQLLPEGFSYGPTILEVTPELATSEGGGTGYIYGYGFVPIDPESTPNLQVQVAGVPAEVTGFAANAYDLTYPPFPLQSVAYTIPPNTGGSVASVSVSTSAGSTVEAGSLSYLSPTQQIPLSGAALAEGIYDPYTGLYYFTDTDKIQVFSKSQGAWQSPIRLSSAANQRLWALALSPNGSQLAVSDAMADVIYVLDMTTTSVKTFRVPPITGASYTNPAGVAISDAGNVYYAIVEQGVGGARQFYKLNTTTGAITEYDIQGPNIPQDIYLRVLISADNSKVFFNDLGYIFYVDTATDAMVPANIFSPCCYLGLGNYDMALSSNQEQFEATGYLYDINLNAESLCAQNDREILNASYVYGAKLSPDGRLLFQPSTNGIDIYDGNLGDLLHRISLPFALSSNYDALVEDGADNVLISITGSGDGIAIVDLSSISEPSPVRHNRRSASRRPHSAKHLNPLVELGQSLRQREIVPYLMNNISFHAR